MEEANPFIYVIFYVCFKFNAAHYFQFKKIIHVLIVLFQIMLENHVPPSWKFSSLMKNSSMKISLQNFGHFFGHLQRELELIIYARMSTLARFLDHWVDTITPGTKTNEICFLAKNTKLHLFLEWSLKLLKYGFLIRWIWRYDFR